MQNQGTHVKAVLFHFESTLIQPTSLDMTAIKGSIGCPADLHIVDYVRNLKSADDRKAAIHNLEDLEVKSADNAVLDPASTVILKYLIAKKVRLAVVTAGGRTFVDTILRKFPDVGVSDFAAIITRRDMLELNLTVGSVRFAAQKMDIAPAELLVVASDPLVLKEAGEFGAQPVSMDLSSNFDQSPPESIYQIGGLNELISIVRMGIPLPAGKLPNDLLREFLNQFEFDDPSILINPGIGEDTAAVDVGPEEVLVLKSDPITFATDAIGQYAVLINANDIATSGAKPRWLLTTLLFPSGVTPLEIRKVFSELKEFSRRWGITLCGGHTEITDAVIRPVVTGMMAGTVARRNLIDKRNMATGDRVLLTKGVSVEGTAIIAREFGSRLAELGLSETEIARCRQFLARISVITEAQLAAQSDTTSAMHDVTEGGLATALEEMSIAGNHRIKIELDAIPVFAETQKICSMLGIQPLGLIGSGSLLICCREAGCQSLMKTIRQSGIEINCIGEVLESGQGIQAVSGGQAIDWPRFEVDEITRLF